MQVSFVDVDLSIHEQTPYFGDPPYIDGLDICLLVPSFLVSRSFLCMLFYKFYSWRFVPDDKKSVFFEAVT